MPLTKKEFKELLNDLHKDSFVHVGDVPEGEEWNLEGTTLIEWERLKKVFKKHTRRE